MADNNNQTQDKRVSLDGMRAAFQKFKDTFTDPIAETTDNIDNVGSVAMARLFALYDGLLELFASIGDIAPRSVDAENGYSVCGQPLMTIGESAPTGVPKAEGCFYYDKTNKVLYVSVAVTGSTNDWQTV